jgi:hypothetical protein
MLALICVLALLGIMLVVGYPMGIDMISKITTGF